MRSAIHKQTYADGRAYRYHILDETGALRTIAEPTGLLLPTPTRWSSFSTPRTIWLAACDLRPLPRGGAGHATRYPFATQKSPARSSRNGGGWSTCSYCGRHAIKYRWENSATWPGAAGMGSRTMRYS